MIRIRTSLLDRYAAYLADDDYPLGVLLRDLSDRVPETPAMQRGHAFAKALENIGTGEASIIQAEGHAFAFTCEAEVEMGSRQEMKAEKNYGGIIVTGTCDRIYGLTIADDKTTASFSNGGVEKYIDKWQWRYYLDIFGAQEFVWHIWETREVDVPKVECECPPYYAKEDRHLADFCPVHGEPQYRKVGAGVQFGWEVFNHHVIKNYRYPELENECREFALGYKRFAEQLDIYA